jgi:hypothetical protein
LNNAEDNRPTVGGLQIYATFLHRDAAVLHTNLPLCIQGSCNFNKSRIVNVI